MCAHGRPVFYCAAQQESSIFFCRVFLSLCIRTLVRAGVGTLGERERTCGLIFTRRFFWDDIVPGSFCVSTAAVRQSWSNGVLLVADAVFHAVSAGSETLDVSVEGHRGLMAVHDIGRRWVFQDYCASSRGQTRIGSSPDKGKSKTVVYLR